MLPLLKKLRNIVLLNAILIIFFVWTSYGIANEFNSSPNDLLYVNWNFFGMSFITHAGTLVNGNYVGIGATNDFFDFPFWLFFVSIAVNMSYIVKLLKEQEAAVKKP